MPPLAMLAKKVGMTRIFESDGTIHPITVLEVGPCRVLKVKKSDGKDKYDALQIGFVKAKEKALNKPQLGYFEKLGVEPYRFVREIRVNADVTARYETGAELKSADVFNVADYVDVRAKTKGRGFAGVMKRHNFHGSKEASHGTHEYFRHGGSIGQASYPGRVMKGMKMPGHYGNKEKTIQNLRIIDMVPERNLVLVRGAVPGPIGGLVRVCRAVKVYGKDE